MRLRDYSKFDGGKGVSLLTFTAELAFVLDKQCADNGKADEAWKMEYHGSTVGICIYHIDENSEIIETYSCWLDHPDTVEEFKKKLYELCEREGLV